MSGQPVDGSRFVLAVLLKQGVPVVMESLRKLLLQLQAVVKSLALPGALRHNNLFQALAKPLHRLLHAAVAILSSITSTKAVRTLVGHLLFWQLVQEDWEANKPASSLTNNSKENSSSSTDRVYKFTLHLLRAK
jgi:hypothetical protein